MPQPESVDESRRDDGDWLSAAAEEAAAEKARDVARSRIADGTDDGDAAVLLVAETRAALVTRIFTAPLISRKRRARLREQNGA
jgi:predicted house-cleaning NTP pyrophosphatase (Maf/HAM1 superfamily)